MPHVGSPFAGDRLKFQLMTCQVCRRKSAAIRRLLHVSALFLIRGLTRLSCLARALYPASRRYPPSDYSSPALRRNGSLISMRHCGSLTASFARHSEISRQRRDASQVFTRVITALRSLMTRIVKGCRQFDDFVRFLLLLPTMERNVVSNSQELLSTSAQAQIFRRGCRGCCPTCTLIA